MPVDADAEGVKPTNVDAIRTNTSRAARTGLWFIASIDVWWVLRIESLAINHAQQWV
ncbi:hypothetical protein MSIM_43930 [Mycobacterium simiae]|nr:hypothetical protein MSIM_43930 [Mycobacterium simiae]